MARTKIPAHVSERLVNRTALRFTQLDNAQKNADESAADMQERLLNNTFWVLDSVGFDRSVIEQLRSDALKEANLKYDPLTHPHSGNGGSDTPPDGGTVPPDAGGGRRKNRKGSDVPTEPEPPVDSTAPELTREPVESGDAGTDTSDVSAAA